MTAIVELKDATVKVNNGFDTEKNHFGSCQSYH